MGTATEERLPLNVIHVLTFQPEQTTKERKHAIFKIRGFVLGKRLMGIIHPVSMLPAFRIVIVN